MRFFHSVSSSPHFWQARCEPLCRFSAAGLAIALLSGSCLLARSAEADAVCSCSQPCVLEGEEINLVILPYNQDLRSPSLKMASRQLGPVLQVDSLLRLGRYGSMGVVYLSAEPASGCDEETVEARLIGNGEGEPHIAAGNAIVILWGRIYEEGGNIYLQSYLRFLRRDRADRVELKLGGYSPGIVPKDLLNLGAGGPFILSGRSPTEQIAFPPRRLTMEDLHAIEAELQEASLLYREPGDTGANNRLRIDVESGSAYGVEQVRTGWLQIYGSHVGGSRWLKEIVPLPVALLHEKLPELDFLAVVTAYMRARISGNFSYWKLRLDEDLARYSKATETAAAPLPAALGKVLAGNLRALGGKTNDAVTLYAEATRLIPYSADAQNLEIISRIASPNANPTVGEELLDALALEPANIDVMRNLEVYYEHQLNRAACPNCLIRKGFVDEFTQKVIGVRKVLKALDALRD